MRNEKKEGGGNNELKQTNKENVKVKKKQKQYKTNVEKQKERNVSIPII